MSKKVKAAAEGGQMCEAAQALVRDAELLVWPEAAVLGAVTRAANHHCVQVASEGGRTITKGNPNTARQVKGGAEGERDSG